MAWARRGFNGTEVWVRTDENGRVRLDSAGRAEMVYRLPPAKVYRPAARNLAPPPPGEPGVKDLLTDAEAAARVAGHPTPPGLLERLAPVAAGPPIVIYTDGACTGNPGPAGVGVVYLDGPVREELSEFLGEGTNNIAELVAVERALEMVPEAGRARPVRVHSDSSYAIGLLSQGWWAKANQELVERLRALVRRFADLRFVKVAGHAGVPENERCDQLARQAIRDGETTRVRSDRGGDARGGAPPSPGNAKKGTSRG